MNPMMQQPMQQMPQLPAKPVAKPAAKKKKKAPAFGAKGVMLAKGMPKMAA